MSMILGMSSSEELNNKSVGNNDIIKALNFCNISKPVSFNDGSDEGYYKVRPKSLMPSKHNPRPDWVIDDKWLETHVGINMDDIFENSVNLSCLVKLEESYINGEMVELAIYPDFKNLINSPNISQKKEYDFLVNLSKSIREIGQIQPIEIESDVETHSLVVLEGHLRRLACILGRVPYIKVIRNEGLQDLTKREKIGRQITENSLRSNITAYGNYMLACDEVNENKKITVRELSSRLRISKDLSSAFIKLIVTPEQFHNSLFDALQKGLLSSNNVIKASLIKRHDKQSLFIDNILSRDNEVFKIAPTARGRDGRKKTVASFKIKTTTDCIKAGNKLLDLIPELKEISNILEINSVEDMAGLLKYFEEFLLRNN